MASRDRDITVDLESGGTTSEEEGSKEPVSGGRQARKVLSRVWSGFLSFDGSIKGEGGMSSCTASNSVDVLTENPESSTDKKSGGEETMGLLEKKMVKEKHKKTSSKKPPKPPRPPRGPSLDAADLKLVRDISELAMLKRARIERMKELKKKKAAKATSSNSSLCAMVVTILFFLIIIFQGKNGKRKSRNVAPESGGVSESHAERAMYSRSSSSVSFQGSPKSTVGLISAQYYKNRSASDTNGTEYGSPN